MNLLCRLGLHAWNGCLCTRCYKTRDQDHDLKECRCLRCMNYQHSFKDIGNEDDWVVVESSPPLKALPHVFQNVTYSVPQECTLCGAKTDILREQEIKW